MYSSSLNVLGYALKPCCTDPVTGFYRDGFCHTGPDDQGEHVVCVELTEDFLAFSKSRGNDLSTPRPEYQFVGLSPGDKWCLCGSRWVEALEAGCAPRIVLESTHIKMLQFVGLEVLQAHSS